VLVCDYLAPEKVNALRIADNRTAAETDWDPAMLANELAELAEQGVELGWTGFSESELSKLLAFTEIGGQTDPDEAPEAPAEPVTQVGDIWRCGPHRLMCGDATVGADVVRLMDGHRAALMATDPPYLVDYTGGWHVSAAAVSEHKWDRPPTADKDWAPDDWDHFVDAPTAVAFYVAFLRLAIDEALIERPAVYQCHGIMRTDIVMEAWRQAGLLAHQILVWHKSRPVLTHAHYMWDYEPFMYGWPEGKMPKIRPPAIARTVWEIESRHDDNPGSVHPTMKPVELIRTMIDYQTRKGACIYDPFVGSGTSLIAAEITGRRCFAMEISPAYCDVAMTRWQNFSGQLAQRS
jgi:DNA modification methylase